MTCEKVQLPNGGVAILCFRGRKRRRALCQFCLRLEATRECDHPETLERTCDAAMCDRCATRIAPDVDLCPVHAQERSIVGAVGDWISYRRRQLARLWLRRMKAEDEAQEMRRSSSGKWDRAVRAARTRDGR
jgi:hypothetical protein